MRDPRANRYPGWATSVDDLIEQEKINWLFTVNEGSSPDPAVRAAYLLKKASHKRRLHALAGRRQRELRGNMTRPYSPGEH